MVILDTALEKRQAENNPVRVGIVGAEKGKEKVPVHASRHNRSLDGSRGLNIRHWWR